MGAARVLKRAFPVFNDEGGVNHVHGRAVAGGAGVVLIMIAGNDMVIRGLNPALANGS